MTLHYHQAIYPHCQEVHVQRICESSECGFVEVYDYANFEKFYDDLHSVSNVRQEISSDKNNQEYFSIEYCPNEGELFIEGEYFVDWGTFKNDNQKAK